MPDQAVILAVTDHGQPWWVGVMSDDGPRVTLLEKSEFTKGDVRSRMGAVAARLREFGLPRDGLVLGVPGRWCFAGSTPTDGLPRRGRHTALLYKMEEHWPVDAEQLTAAFTEHHGHAFGVAVRTEHVKPLLDALTEEGVSVQHLIPTALLLAPLYGTNQVTCDVVWLRRGHVDLIRYRGGRVASWRYCPGIDDAIDLLRTPAPGSPEPPGPPGSPGVEDVVLRDAERLFSRDGRHASANGKHKKPKASAPANGSGDLATLDRRSHRSPPSGRHEAPLLLYHVDDGARDDAAASLIRLARPDVVIADDDARTAVTERAAELALGWSPQARLRSSDESSENEGSTPRHPDAKAPILRMVAPRKNGPTLPGAGGGVDLRRGALGATDRIERLVGPLTALTTAVAILLMSVGLTQFGVARSTQRATERAEEAQAALFRETFPGRLVPVALLSRLRSEAAEARGLAGEPADTAQAVDVLDDLQAVLEHLPPTDTEVPSSTGANQKADAHAATPMRYRLLELRLDARRLYLDGQARSHGEAERLAAGLRAVPGFAFDSPRTQNLNERGVGFTLSGQRAEATTAADARGSTSRSSGGGS